MMRRVLLGVVAGGLVGASVYAGLAVGASRSATGQTRWVVERLVGMEEAVAINERGQVAGATLKNRPVEWHALLWEKGRLRDLGHLGVESLLPTPADWVRYPEPGADLINDRGQIVGQSVGQSSPRVYFEHAFLWQNGKMRDLGTLGGTDSKAVAINERGQVIGRSDTGKTDNDGGRIWHAFVWENGEMRDLGKLGGEEGTFGITVDAINDRGQIVGNSTTDKHGMSDLGFRFPYTRAFLWSGGKMRDLGTLGGPQSWSAAINNRGQIIGVADTEAKTKDGSPIHHAFLWQNGRMRDLGDWRVVGINEQTQIIGSKGTRSCRRQAVLWERGRLRKLGVLPGDSYSQAIAINDRGQIIGVSYDSCSGPGSREVEESRPFIWENGRMKPLPGLPAGATSTVGAINNRGQIIGQAWGGSPSGSFLWTPRTG